MTANDFHSMHCRECTGMAPDPEVCTLKENMVELFKSYKESLIVLLRNKLPGSNGRRAEAIIRGMK